MPARNRIWRSITFAGLTAAIIAGISVIAFTKDTERRDAARLVFYSLLPLLGTWVGTIFGVCLAEESLELSPINSKKIIGIAERIRSAAPGSMILNMFWVMFGSLLALGIFVIIYARDADRSDAARLVFGSIVPLIGTWVGTVLGFYFGRENFKAASTSITAASSSITPQGKLETTPVASLGKKIQTTAKFQLGASDTKEDLTLDKIESAFVVGSEVYERLPLLLASGAPYMVLHRSTLNEFLLQKIKTDKTTDSKNYTLAELLTSEPWLPERSFAVVSMEATAAQAKVEMDKIPTCSDIFVTENGTRHSTVSRWITDVNLLEAARSLTIE